MDVAQEVLFPQDMQKKCQDLMKQLSDFKKDISDKQNKIDEQNKDINERIKKLSKVHPSLKINHQQRAAFEEDCKKYINALNGIIQDIDAKTSALNEILTTTKETIEKVVQPPKDKVSQDIPFEVKKALFFGYIQQQILQTKQFAKRIKKEIAVSHSRFNFSLETQLKQIAYLEISLSARQK